MVRTRRTHQITTLTLMENAKREVPATSYGIVSSQDHARRLPSYSSKLRADRVRRMQRKERKGTT